MGDVIAGGVEVVEVREPVAEGVAHLAVGLGDPRDDLVGEADVVAVVLRRDPEPDDLGAVLLEELVGVDVVAERLAELSALRVDEEAVGEAGLERRALAAHRQRGQQGRLEPAAVLVGALEVEVRGDAQTARLERRRPSEMPESNQTSRMSSSLVKLAAAALRALLARPATARFAGQLEPGVRALLLEAVGDALEHRRRRAATRRSPRSRTPGWARPRRAGG